MPFQSQISLQRGLCLTPFFSMTDGEQAPPQDTDAAAIPNPASIPKTSTQPRYTLLSCFLPKHKLTVLLQEMLDLPEKGSVGGLVSLQKCINEPPVIPCPLLPLESSTIRKQSRFLACIVSNSEPPQGIHQLSGCQRNMENM